MATDRQVFFSHSSVDAALVRRLAVDLISLGADVWLDQLSLGVGENFLEKIETAVEPKFQEHFVNAIAIPHKTDPFPQWEKLVALKTGKFGGESGAAADGSDGVRRRRRRTRA